MVSISTLQGEESITKRISTFRQVLTEGIEINEFDSDMLDSLVEKIVIGATDENGEVNPYVITFVFKAGMKFNEEFYEKVANSSTIIEEDDLSTYATNEKQVACTYAPNKACGDDCRNIKKTLVIFASSRLKPKFYALMWILLILGISG